MRLSVQAFFKKWTRVLLVLVGQQRWEGCASKKVSLHASWDAPWGICMSPTFWNHHFADHNASPVQKARIQDKTR